MLPVRLQALALFRLGWRRWSPWYCRSLHVSILHVGLTFAGTAKWCSKRTPAARKGHIIGDISMAGAGARGTQYLVRLPVRIRKLPSSGCRCGVGWCAVIGRVGALRKHWCQCNHSIRCSRGQLLLQPRDLNTMHGSRGWRVRLWCEWNLECVLDRLGE
jgi:hypothetical protein